MKIDRINSIMISTDEVVINNTINGVDKIRHFANRNNDFHNTITRNSKPLAVPLKDININTTLLEVHVHGISLLYGEYKKQGQAYAGFSTQIMLTYVEGIA